ncbi:MAG: hypothetical protein Q4B60_03560 [Erysipelotrichaceae bacterium]|nr:hypothetical protein [Erysipelotrichaceae bacterium]
MKSFFEEYGFVMLAAVVLIALIAMASPIANTVQSNITTTMNSFSTKVSGDLTNLGNKG